MKVSLCCVPTTCRSNPLFAPLFAMVNAAATEQLRPVLGGASAPLLHFEAVELFAGEVHVKVTPKTENHEGVFATTCENFIVRFVDDVDWKSWIDQHVAGTTAITEGDFAYVKLPGTPDMGGVSMLVAERDSRTLVFATSVERLRRMAKPVASEQTASLPRTLAGVDGGLAAIALTAKLNGGVSDGDEASDEQDQADAPTDALEALGLAVVTNASQSAAGFDLMANDESGLRVVFTCADSAAADRLRSAIAAAQPAATDMLATIQVTPPGPDNPWGDTENHQLAARWFLSLLQSCQTNVVPQDNGMVEVRVEATAPFPRSSLAIIFPTLTPVTSPAVAQAVDAERK